MSGNGVQGPIGEALKTIAEALPKAENIRIQISIGPYPFQDGDQVIGGGMLVRSYDLRYGFARDVDAQVIERVRNIAQRFEAASEKR